MILDISASIVKSQLSGIQLKRSAWCALIIEFTTNSAENVFPAPRTLLFRKTENAWNALKIPTSTWALNFASDVLKIVLLTLRKANVLLMLRKLPSLSVLQEKKWTLHPILVNVRLKSPITLELNASNANSLSIGTESSKGVNNVPMDLFTILLNQLA